MKKNLLVTLSIILFTTEILFPQIKPESFFIGKKSAMDKTALSSTPSSNSITDIIVVGDTVWLGMGTGVSLSTDRGATWTNYAGTQAFGSESISAIGYYQGTFWAATAHDENTSQGTVQTGSGLRYTTDAGKNWTTIPQPVDQESDSVITYGINKLSALPVTVPEQNVIFDMTFTPGTIWIATFAAGVRRSTDMGKTWQRVVLPPDNLNSISPNDTLNFYYSPVAGKMSAVNNYNLEGFSILAVNDSTIYAGTAGGINLTTDANSQYPSWTKFNHTNENNPISGNWVTALGYNNTDHTIWAGSWKADGETEFYAVSFSSDGGANWQTTLDQQKVYNFGIKDNQVIAASDAGAFRTSDSGKDWILPNTITDANTKISILTQSFYAAGFQGSSVWLGSGDGLARLDETGGMWQGTWKVYFASQPLASSSDAYAYPNPFNPRTDVLKIKYSTNGTEPVTIRILNFSMQVVKTIIQDANRGNPIHVVDSSSGTIDYWDGTDQAGNIVPNGVYFYRIDVGSQKPVYGKILVLQ